MIKKLISSIRKKKEDPSVRPWGNYKILHEEETCKVKIITVLPGKRLSLQSHEKREEIWVVTEGSGMMTLGVMKFTMKVGDKVKIPYGTKHRIENIGTVPLKFIEVQTGTYFGEDDIVRYEDDYGRAK
jgi:mannose-6-phosphate isomerase-like protein (cupin superfamily)